MKTTSYNPSPLEVAFAKALNEISDHLESKLGDLSIDKVECDTESDNPHVTYHVKDQDGDPHEVVLKIIQLPDKF